MEQSQIDNEEKGYAALNKLIPIDETLALKNNKALEVINAKSKMAGSDNKYFVIVLPGGGYEFTSYRESRQVAKAFAVNGFDTGILHYTTKHLQDVFDSNAATGVGIGFAPIIDVAFAIEELRLSEKYRNHKIIVCGFSAGGHLASAISTLYDCVEVKNAYNFTQNLRPDGSILSYPVICSDPQYSHHGSFEVLTGSKDPQDWVKFSSDLNITKDTPPAFLWHTATDDVVSVTNTIKYAQRMWELGNIAEIIVYPQGAHGSSLNTKDVEPSNDFFLADEHRATWLIKAISFVKKFV